MKISVFGLGYVGCVTAACLAESGYNVIGIDINRQKVEEINRGESPVIEKDLDRMISDAVTKKKLFATTDATDAVHSSEISLICVGTPSNHNGSINISYLKNVCKDIGNALAGKKGFHVVVIRSTIFPGTTETTLIPLLEEASNKRCSKDFGVCVNPEFMREGSAIYDFDNPELIVIGSLEERSLKSVEKIYSSVSANIIRTNIKTAEMIKYVNNSFHGLKVCFANEIGTICKQFGIDSHIVMDIFCKDSKLNLSPYYLKPGLAFGGSCLPKDTSVIAYEAKKLDIDVPLLEAIFDSNRKQIDRAIDMITVHGKKKIGIFGLAFKAGTDDLRESPVVIIAETLIGKGYSLHIYDKAVAAQNLIGSNRAFIEEKLPHIASLLCSSIEEVVDRSEILVVANKSEEFKKIPTIMNKDQILVDFVRILEPSQVNENKYFGISW